MQQREGAGEVAGHGGGGGGGGGGGQIGENTKRADSNQQGRSSEEWNVRQKSAPLPVISGQIGCRAEQKQGFNFVSIQIFRNLVPPLKKGSKGYQARKCYVHTKVMMWEQPSKQCKENICSKKCEHGPLRNQTYKKNEDLEKHIVRALVTLFFVIRLVPNKDSLILCCLPWGEEAHENPWSYFHLKDHGVQPQKSE